MKAAKPTFVFLYLLLISSAISQSRVDSLYEKLNAHMSTDTTRVLMLTELAELLLSQDIDRIDTLLNESLLLSEKLKFPKGLAESHRLWGRYSHVKSDYPQSIKHFEEAIISFTLISDLEGVSGCYLNIGTTYLRQAKYEDALRYYNQAKDIISSIEGKPGLEKVLNNIGIIYYYQGDFLKALDQYQAALKIIELKGDTSQLARATNNIGIIFDLQGDRQHAIEYYEKALALYQNLNDNLGMVNIYNNLGSLNLDLKNYDKALEYLQSGMAVNEKVGDKGHNALLSNSLGMLYIALGKFQEAKAQFSSSLAISVEIDDLDIVARNQKELGTVYLELGDPNLALRFAKKAYENAVQLSDPNLLKSCAEVLASVNAATGNYKAAFNYYQEFKTLNDSLFNAENVKKVTAKEFEYNYEKEQMARELEQQKKDALTAEFQKRQTLIRNALIVGVMFLIAFALFIYRNYRQKRRGLILLSEKNYKIEQQSDELRQKNEQLTALDRFKENMTGMIVHDLKNPLNAIISNAEMQDSENWALKVGQSARQMLNMVLNILDVYKYENVAMQVSPKDTSLIDILNDSVEEVSFLAHRKSIKIMTLGVAECGVKADGEIIKRVFVNILTNAIKFSPNNGEITISSELNSTDVQIKIKDHGAGIPEDQLDSVFERFKQFEKKKSGGVASTGLGLSFCKMAIEAHGGKIGVTSKEGEGAEFWFTLQVSEESVFNDQVVIYQVIVQPLDFTLSVEEQALINPVLTRLKEYMVYEVSAVQEIIEELNDVSSEPIQNWMKAMNDSLYSMNEEKYHQLINL